MAITYKKTGRLDFKKLTLVEAAAVEAALQDQLVEMERLYSFAKRQKEIAPDYVAANGQLTYASNAVSVAKRAIEQYRQSRHSRKGMHLAAVNAARRASRASGTTA